MCYSIISYYITPWYQLLQGSRLRPEVLFFVGVGWCALCGVVSLAPPLPMEDSRFSIVFPCLSHKDFPWGVYPVFRQTQMMKFGRLIESHTSQHHSRQPKVATGSSHRHWWIIINHEDQKNHPAWNGMKWLNLDTPPDLFAASKSVRTKPNTSSSGRLNITA